MEITADNATSSKTETTQITSLEPVSDLNNHTIITITGMAPDFHKAAVEGNVDVFKGKGEQIESILTPNKNTILHIHFTNETNSVSETFVEEVLGMCPALFLKANVKDETILHIAARYGHHQIVKNLIDFAKLLPKDINEVGVEQRLIRAINDKKNTALHEAACYGHIEVVDILIKEEPDHSYFGKNVDDETPLYIAVERKYWNVVDTILDNSNSPQYDGPSGRTALHAAILHRDKEKVSKLLTRNLRAAKQADENGWVPLHLAALCDSSDVIEVLLRNDRTIAYMRDNKGRTALHFAALREDSSIMEKIIEYCPDCCELVDEKGFNALHYTTMGNRNYWSGLKHIVQEAPLIRNLCNEKDEDGNTPFHLLARQAPNHQSAYCYHPLLEPQFPRVDKMAFNKYGQTVLDVAVANVHPYLACKNIMLSQLQTIGTKLGGRVLDKHLREKRHDSTVDEKEKQYKKRHDSTIDEKEKQYKLYDQDYSTRVATTFIIVAVLIATVTFTAAFTLPGGMIQEGEHQGYPILMHKGSFKLFVLTDSLSFILSASTVFILFFSSIVRRKKEEFLSLRYKCGGLILMAMIFMVMAFGAGLCAVLDDSKVFRSVIFVIVWSFFFINSIVNMRDLKAEKWLYKTDYSLQRAREIQLSHIL